MGKPTVEEVAEVIADADTLTLDDERRLPDHPIDSPTWHGYMLHARAVLALFEPETVSTAEELDALPVGSVVLDHMEDAHQRFPLTWTDSWSDTRDSAEMVRDIGFTFTVIYRPESEDR